MCDQIKNASIEWQDERTPISKKFDDPYFSVFDGLEETRHVFLSGNNLHQRFKDGFHVAELGGKWQHNRFHIAEYKAELQQNELPIGNMKQQDWSSIGFI